jgi:hypothetical protein
MLTDVSFADLVDILIDYVSATVTSISPVLVSIAWSEATNLDVKALVVGYQIDILSVCHSLSCDHDIS